MMQTVLKNSSEAKFSPNSRYLVPDLSPRDRKVLAKLRPKWVFVAESPHVSEVTPEKLDQRRPLCGVAGRQWWSLLSELLENEANSDVSLERMIEFCSDYKIAVMNAVQYPLDPKVSKEFHEADPEKNLGFNKVSGAYSFKRLKNTTPVQRAIADLRERLNHPSVQDAQVYCLGNDAEWFVTQALGKDKASLRLGTKIPHPSAWWRRGGAFGRMARERLELLFSSQRVPKQQR